jgi:hypothetical protein
VKLRQIEVDEETALLLEARAGARGMTVSELLADLACTYEVLPPDLTEMRNKGEGPRCPEVLERTGGVWPNSSARAKACLGRRLKKPDADPGNA